MSRQEHYDKIRITLDQAIEEGWFETNESAICLSDECNNPVDISKITSRKKRVVRGEYKRFCSPSCAIKSSKKLLSLKSIRHWTDCESVKNEDGYVVVLLGKYHPRARTRGRTLEHILIMEDALGRTLFPYPQETVHHINGVRHDNRLENLELWSSSQPPGQRVEDLIRWAKEILDLYGS